MSESVGGIVGIRTSETPSLGSFGVKAIVFTGVCPEKSSTPGWPSNLDVIDL